MNGTPQIEYKAKLPSTVSAEELHAYRMSYKFITKLIRVAPFIGDTGFTIPIKAKSCKP